MTCIESGCRRIAVPGFSRCDACITALLRRMGL